MFGIREAARAAKTAVVMGAKAVAACAAAGAAYGGYRVYKAIEATDAVEAKMAVYNAERAEKATKAVLGLIRTQKEVATTSLAPIKPREVLIIAASDTETSLRGVCVDLQLKFLAGGPHRSVIVFSYKPTPEDVKAEAGDRVKYVQVDSADYQNPEKMHRIVSEHLTAYDSPIKTVGMACCLGAANLREGETLEGVNIYPLINTAEAVVDVAGRLPGIKSITMVNIGSIAPTIIKDACAYSISRMAAEDALLLLAKSAKVPADVSVTGLSFRPGIIYGPYTDMIPYSIEQMALMTPFQIVPGSGSQDIPAISSSDLATAIVNAVDKEEKKSGIVDAVVRHRYTFAQLIDHFAKIAKTDVAPMYVPHGFVKAIAKSFPYGKLAEYSGMLFAETDVEGYTPPSPEEFEAFLGKEADKLEDAYPESIPFEALPPPLKAHLKLVCASIMKDPRLAMALTKALYENKYETASSVARAVARHPVPLAKPVVSQLV